MAIRRGLLPADHFTMIPNRWTRDPRISWGAKGLLSYIAGHEVGYELTMDQMISEGTLGRDGLLTLIRELEGAGYLRRTRQRAQDGRLGSYDYDLVDDQAAQDHSGLSRAGSEQPKPEFPQVAPSAAQATMDEAAHKEEHSSKKTKKNTTPPEGDAAAPAPAQEIVASWIDFCAGRDIRLPKQVIGRYAAEIKKLLDGGFTDRIIKIALGRMLDRGKASHPALLPQVVVEVQEVRPPGPSGDVRPAYRSAAERADDRRRDEAEIAKLADRLAAEVGADGTDPAENVRIGRQAREIWQASKNQGDHSTSCLPTGYSETGKPAAGVVVDAVSWWAHENEPPKEVTAT